LREPQTGFYNQPPWRPDEVASGFHRVIICWAKAGEESLEKGLPGGTLA